MTAPPFVFNSKTGELQRGGRAITLCRFRADIFNCFAHAQTMIGAGAIAKAIGAKKVDDVANEIPRLAKQLVPLGIRIARDPGRGSWLTFEDVPKWRPSIPPPVRLDGEAR